MLRVGGYGWLSHLPRDWNPFSLGFPALIVDNQPQSPKSSRQAFQCFLAAVPHPLQQNSAWFVPPRSLHAVAQKLEVKAEIGRPT